MSWGVTGLVASTAVAPLLDGPPRRLPQTVAVAGAAGFGPIAIVGRDSHRPPHGVVVADDLLAAAVRSGHVRVGDGEVVIGGVRAGGARLRPTRWWDPRPALGTTTEAVLRTALQHLPGPDCSLLRLFVIRAPVLKSQTREMDGSVEGVAGGQVGGGVVRHLLGRGVGLTPEGDDLLVGLLAAGVLLPPALRLGQPAWVRRVGAEVEALAAGRTTDLSARLLLHAARGQVMGPLADALRAITAGGVPAAAVRLAAVGHTSGRAMLAGLAEGTRMVLDDVASAGRRAA